MHDAAVREPFPLPADTQLMVGPLTRRKLQQNFLLWLEPSDALLLDDRAFYACAAGIALTTHRHQTVAGVLSGNGLVQPKMSGKGVFAVEAPVPVEEIDTIELDGRSELIVDGDFMLMYSASLNVSIGPLV